MARVAARWSRLALPSAPCARSSHGLTVLGKQAFVFGGEHVPRRSINTTLHCLDMGGGKPSWSMLHHAKCPPARVGHAQTAVDGKLFVFGGRTGVDMGETALDDLWSFCPVKSAWRQLSAGSPPSARSFHASAAAGSKLYVFGGCGAGVRLADLHEFDTASGAWKQLPSPPEVAGRGGATLEASADGRYLWLMCGFAGHETDDLLRFCLASHTWERRPSEWLRPRSVCASFTTCRGVFLFGGEDGTPLSVVVEGETDAAPVARGWAAAAALSDSQAVLFGGLAGTDEAPQRLDDAWLLSLD